jgi:hypothetical protein
VKVKVFAVSGGYFSRISTTGEKVERQINGWLEANPAVRVVNVLQSASGGSLEPSKPFVAVWYEDGVEPPRGGRAPAAWWCRRTGGPTAVRSFGWSGVSN